MLRPEPYLYCAPALILIAAIMLVPLVVGLSYAFRDLTLLDPLSGDYIGFDHFREIWADANFWNALQQHRGLDGRLRGAAVRASASCWRCCSTALSRAAAVIQALVFLPWAVPSFLSGLNWAWLFNPVVGPLPYWFQALGLMTTPDNLLSDPEHALWGPIIAMVWWGIPFFAITLLAALQSIPEGHLRGGRDRRRRCDPSGSSRSPCRSWPPRSPSRCCCARCGSPIRPTSSW